MKSLDQIVLDKKLNELIETHGISLHQLSIQSRVNKSSLHNYINGILPQGLAALKKICNCFEVSLDELVFGTINEDLDDSTQNIEETYENHHQKNSIQVA